MISAKDALLLPSAQLTPQEREGVVEMLQWLDKEVRKQMKRDGVVDLKIETGNRSVIAEVNQVLKQKGWLPSWTAIVQSHPLNKAVQVIAGYVLRMAPNDEAYHEAEGLGASAVSSLATS